MKRALAWIRQRQALFAIVFVLIGTILRLSWPADMEYKSDEEYMFLKLLHVGNTEPWPWLGIPSGVYVRNPGMSVWVFVLLGKLVGATDPVGLAQGVMFLNSLALLILAIFALNWVKSEEREPWLFGLALAAVNPIALLYHRKIWSQSVLPFFCMLFLLSWWKRSSRKGAFFWGLVGACLGQIHMSGFFFALGFTLWAALFDRTSRIPWKAWFAGSCVGSITLLPWIWNLLTERTGHSIGYGFQEASQLKFWVFWITDPLGLHLGNALGVLNGNSTAAQLGDFLRYPLWDSSPTYLIGAAHALLVLAGAFALLRGVWILARHLRTEGRPASWLIGRSSESAFTRNAAFIGYGILLTFSTLIIRRYYLLITFPLEYVWLAGLCLMGARSAAPSRRVGRFVLAVILLCELVISLGFLDYIHRNEGSLRGDYGRGYRWQPSHR